MSIVQMNGRPEKMGWILEAYTQALDVLFVVLWLRSSSVHSPPLPDNQLCSAFTIEVLEYDILG